jgi:hypothetical protein
MYEIARLVFDRAAQGTSTYQPPPIPPLSSSAYSIEPAPAQQSEV